MLTSCFPKEELRPRLLKPSVHSMMQPGAQLRRAIGTWYLLRNLVAGQRSTSYGRSTRGESTELFSALSRARKMLMTHCRTPSCVHFWLWRPLKAERASILGSLALQSTLHWAFYASAAAVRKHRLTRLLDGTPNGPLRTSETWHQIPNTSSANNRDAQS